MDLTVVSVHRPELFVALDLLSVKVRDTGGVGDACGAPGVLQLVAQGTEVW